MFSLDILLLAYGKSVVAFLVANKFSVLAIFYALEKLAQKTKTTVDDSIVTFLKNTRLRLMGRGGKVIAEYEKLKSIGLIHEKLDGKTLQHLKEKFDTPKMDINKYPDPDTKPMLNELKDAPINAPMGKGDKPPNKKS